MDIVQRLNAELGLDGAKANPNAVNGKQQAMAAAAAAAARKLRLPSQLEAKGYKALKLIGEGAYGKALLVSTDGSTSAASSAPSAPSHQAHPLAPSEARPVPSLIIVKHINMAQYTRQERQASKNEINFLKRLCHPNIIRYIDSVEDGANDLYILMEYADCGDLEAKCKKGKRLEEREVLALFAQIVDAVGYMHGLKVLHRDLKPQNVFMSGGGSQVKIGDFGISKSLNHTKAMAHTVCGTPYYFSPELCKGRPYNAASDVWALGVMLYEMLTRRMPFDAKTMTQLMTAICTGPLTRRPEIANDNAWALITAMLSREPSKRPDCSAILLHPALRGHTNAATTNANGVPLLPVPSHMAHARRPSVDMAPLPLHSNSPPPSHAPTPVATPPSSRHPSPGRGPVPSPPRAGAPSGGRAGQQAEQPGPNAPGRAPLPTPYGAGAGRPSPAALKAQHKDHRERERERDGDDRSARDHHGHGREDRERRASQRERERREKERPRNAVVHENRHELNAQYQQQHANGQQPPPTRLPFVAGAGRPHYFGGNGGNNQQTPVSTPTAGALNFPPPHANNQSPNSDNRHGGGEGIDDDGVLLRQQEAALIRARIAAKNEEYNFNRAKNHARPY